MDENSHWVQTIEQHVDA
jgi:hypothetical protein